MIRYFGNHFLATAFVITKEINRFGKNAHRILKLFGAVLCDEKNQK
jgi:hypothetical protein